MLTLEYLVSGHYRQAARLVKDTDADAALVFYLPKAARCWCSVTYWTFLRNDHRKTKQCPDSLPSTMKSPACAPSLSPGATSGDYPPAPRLSGPATNLQPRPHRQRNTPSGAERITQ
jgi:hypothetical protein